MNSKQVWPQAATMWSTTWLIEIQIKVTKAIACVTHYCYYYWLLLLLLITVVVIDYCCCYWLLLSLLSLFSLTHYPDYLDVHLGGSDISLLISSYLEQNDFLPGWCKKRPSWKFKVLKRTMEGKRSLTSCQTYFTPQFTPPSIVVYTFISCKAVLQRQKFKEM